MASAPVWSVNKPTLSGLPAALDAALDAADDEATDDAADDAGADDAADDDAGALVGSGALVGATDDAADDAGADDAGALVGSGVGEAHAANTSARASNENKTIFFMFFSSEI
jgi:hypothetical protein